jgi:four helix bundle protein
MASARSHRELVVWRKSMDLAVEVYRVAAGFPAYERYGFTSQLTRAAVSVPANIAEGSGRGSIREYAHFVSIARGSLMETETLIMLAVRLGYATDGQVRPILDLVTEISKMLAVLRGKLLRE